MISWATVLYGAALTFVLVAAAALSARQRLASVLAAATASAGGAIAWNALLHATGGHNFFADAPVAVLHVSWQDTGSGVFALAATSVVLGLVPNVARPQARRHVSPPCPRSSPSSR